MGVYDEQTHWWLQWNRQEASCMHPALGFVDYSYKVNKPLAIYISRLSIHPCTCYVLMVPFHRRHPKVVCGTTPK